MDFEQDSRMPLEKQFWRAFLLPKLAHQSSPITGWHWNGRCSSTPGCDWPCVLPIIFADVSHLGSRHHKKETAPHLTRLDQARLRITTRRSRLEHTQVSAQAKWPLWGKEFPFVGANVHIHILFIFISALQYTQQWKISHNVTRDKGILKVYPYFFYEP